MGASRLMLYWHDDALKERGYALMLDPQMARALAPLPRDRELGGFAAIEAINQLEQRRWAAKSLGEMLAAAILDMARFADPENGYERVHEEATAFKAGLRYG